jgi:hypothetical protein
VLPLKDLRKRTVGEKVTVWDGKRLEELEGLPGGRAWSQARRIVPVTSTSMAYWYS